MIRRVYELARVELIRRIRNRSALITAFLAPLVVASIFGLLLSGGDDGSAFELGVVDLERSPASAAIVDALTDSSGEGVEFRRYANRDEAFAAVDDGDVGAAIVVGTRLEVIRSADRTLSGQIAEGIAASISARRDTSTLALHVVAAASGTPPSPAIQAAAAGIEPAITMRDAGVGEELDSHAFYGASMAIVFLFFTVGFAGRSIHAERRSGLLARVQSSPATPIEILAAKAIAVAVLAMSGFVTVWAITTQVFGARWGDPLGVVVVMLATVVALAGVATFVAALARTEQQADSYSSVVTFTFALLGGNFVGPSAPPLLQRLSKFTPNGWALDAFTELSADPVGVGAVLGPVAVLLGFAVLFGSIGTLRLHRGFAP